MQSGVILTELAAVLVASDGSSTRFGRFVECRYLDIEIVKGRIREEVSDLDKLCFRTGFLRPLCENSLYDGDVAVCRNIVYGCILDCNVRSYSLKRIPYLRRRRR